MQFVFTAVLKKCWNVFIKKNLEPMSLNYKIHRKLKNKINKFSRKFHEVGTNFFN